MLKTLISLFLLTMTVLPYITVNHLCHQQAAHGTDPI